MTAIVSILNKHAVAIAADSAVTFGRKVINSGNKIFTLSKYHPVAIMTYNNASYMGTPLDTLIKVFRKELGEKEFDTVDQYADEFLKFLHGPSLFSEPECADGLINHLVAFYHLMINTAKAEKHVIDEKAPDAYSQLKITLDKWKIEYSKQTKSKDFEGYSYDEFVKDAAGVIDVFKKMNKRIAIPVDEYDNFLLVFYTYLLSDAMYNDYCGIAITGYGKSELFPALVHIYLSVRIKERIRYCRIPTFFIGNGNTPARIIPFAQIKTEQTIVNGIHPDIKTLITTSFTNIMNDIGKKIPGFDGGKYAKLFNDEIDDYIKENLTGPFMDTVVHLNKEDMADVAENIVYLTSLMKKVSPEEETVGGPVDVAVISKGDGFVWMKRKHYFEPEMNPHFIHNYFKKNEE